MLTKAHSEDAATLVLEAAHDDDGMVEGCAGELIALADYGVDKENAGGVGCVAWVVMDS